MTAWGRRLAAAVLAAALCACVGDDGGTDAPTEPEIPDHARVWPADSLAAADTLQVVGGLEWVQLQAGDGRRAGRGSIISVHYTGMLTDGTIFDSSYPRGAPFSFVLGVGRVIAGWDEGLSGLHEGARGRLIIPPAMAYGEGGSGPIPPGATLLFDIWIVGVD